MTDPRKKAAAPFNKAAENYIKDPADVARAIAAIKARKPGHLSAREKKRAEVEAHFDSYHSVIAPFIDTLQKMPAQNGMEFFARADLYQSAKSQQDHIHVWLFYGRPSDAGMMAGVPSTHGVAVSAKDETRKVQTTHVALSTRPVLEIEMKPEKDSGTHGIESRIYTERYVRKKDGIPAGVIVRGEFVSDNVMIEQARHATLTGALKAIDSWLQKAVPERLPEIRDALGIHDTPALKDDVSVMRPATIRKRPQP